MNPQNASILNALRTAREVVEENRRLQSGEEIEDLRKLCTELERENIALKKTLASIVNEKP
jgi:cell shape-determining protein MreC